MIPELMVGYIGTAVMLVLLFMGMPIYLSLGLVGFLGIVWMKGLTPGLAALSSQSYEWASYYPLMTIPLFMLMGNFAFHSGISRALYAAAYKFIGHFRGGLAMSTVAASTGFAACSGSSIANSATMGAIAIPEMYQHKYDKRLSAGSVAAGGTIGTMIPPSTGFIVIGAITAQSIGKLFLAGIFPGLIMMTTFMAVIFIRTKINPKLAPIAPAFSWKERFASLVHIWMPLSIFILIIGGMFIGYFTPVEAAAVGAFGTFLFLLLRKRLTREVITSSLVETVKTTAMLFIIFIGAGIFGLFLMLTGLPTSVAGWIAALPIYPHVILVAVLAFYIPLGMVMEGLAAIIVTLPIFYPIIQSLGFDMIWFGVLVLLMGELGLITPPVGMCVYVLKTVTGLSLEDIFRGVMPFIFSYAIIIAILVAFPQISLWLPSMMD